MLYLHISTYESKTFLAILSEEPLILSGHHEIVDFEIVESRNEAQDWYLRQCKERGNVKKQDALRVSDFRSEGCNRLRP